MFLIKVRLESHTHTYLQFKDSISHLSVQAYVCLYEVHRGSCDRNSCSNYMTHSYGACALPLPLFMFLFLHPPPTCSPDQHFSLSFFHCRCCHKRLYLNKWNSPNTYPCSKPKRLMEVNERQLGLSVDFLQRLTYTRTRSKRALMGGWALAPCSVEQNGAVEMIHG